MSAADLREEQRSMALHEAIGWLVSSIECERPGFVGEQARCAGDTPVGQVLSDWARRLGQKGRTCRRCRRRLGESRFIARQRVCIRCKFGLTESNLTTSPSAAERTNG